MRILRRKAKTIKIGNICIGANNPIVIQSMTKSETSDISKTIGQIEELERAGCEIVRLAVKDKDDAKAIKTIKQKTHLPIIADIHFNWRLAIEAIDSGVDKIRLNPGNIYKREQIRNIVAAAKLNRIPIRVGVNSGSLNGHRPSAEKMVRGALDYIRVLEKFGFYDIIISLKASNVFDTIESYRKMAKLSHYPFHLGVTATGTAYSGLIKSSIALGVLLSEGIGDTVRVSLTDTPCAEVKAAQFILEAIGLRRFGPEVISCPTCGRCEVDLVNIVKDLENKLATRYSLLATTPLKVAVMGCVVNGPGEAKDSDIGIAFGKKEGLLFRKGEPVRKVSAAQCADVLLDEILRK